MRSNRIALIVVIAACRDAPPPRATLAQSLATLASADAATRADVVARWRLDRATWERTVVPIYAGLHAEYARAFDAAAPALVAQLARPGTVTTRPHFAGDPRLTLGQARTRWALPVQYPSELAELDGSVLDAVFIDDGKHRWMITGLDGVLRDRAAAFDPACAAHLDVLPSPTTKQCNDIGWVIADAALRLDRPRFDHACSLAATLCAR